MTLTPKWIFGILFLWVCTVAFTSVIAGVPLLGGAEANVFNPLVNPAADISGVGQIYHLVTAILGFGGEGASDLGINMTFFNDGIGYWIRVVLLTLTAAIALPLAFDTARLLIPWKR